MRRVAVLLVALAFVAVLASCSDDDGGDDVSAGDTSGSTDESTPVKLDGEVNNKGTKELTGANPELELEVDDNYFEPTFVQAEPGATVKVTLHNEGSKDHTFTIDGGPDEKLSPDDETEVEVTAPESGELTFFCSIHRRSGMQGAFFTSGSGASDSGTPTTTATGSDSGSSSGGGY